MAASDEESGIPTEHSMSALDEQSGISAEPVTAVEVDSIVESLLQGMLPRAPDGWLSRQGIVLIAQAVVDLLVFCNLVHFGACVPVSQITHPYCDAFMHTSCAIFLIEMVIKIAWLAGKYFKARQNLVDFALCVGFVADLWVRPLLLHEYSQATVVTDALMLLRVVKLIEVLGCRKEVKVLLKGLGASLQSIFWVLLMFGILIYVVAVFCISHFQDVGLPDGYSFDTLPGAMLTTFSLGLLAEWTNIIMPSLQQYWWSPWFFIPFVFLSNLTLLNLVVGVIAEKTVSIQQEFAQKADFKERLERLQKVETIADILFKNNDTITREELVDLMAKEKYSEKVGELLAGVSLPKGYDIMDCFCLFDRDATGSITRSELVEGMHRLLFSTEFQRSFEQQSSVADLKSFVAASEMRILGQLRKEFHQLRYDLAAACPRSGGDDASSQQHEQVVCSTKEDKSILIQDKRDLVPTLLQEAPGPLQLPINLKLSSPVHPAVGLSGFAMLESPKHSKLFTRQSNATSPSALPAFDIRELAAVTRQMQEVVGQLRCADFGRSGTCSTAFGRSASGSLSAESSERNGPTFGSALSSVGSIPEAPDHSDSASTHSAGTPCAPSGSSGGVNGVGALVQAIDDAVAITWNPTVQQTLRRHYADGHGAVCELQDA